MSTFKKAKVVMLSTNEPSKIGNLATYQKRSLAKVIKEGINPIGSTVQFWNLYIISDDEIKEGDYRLDVETGKIWKVTNENTFKHPSGYTMPKIIATTDESLHIPFVTPGNEELEIYEYSILPKPSDSFISKYIEEYNKGNVITDVLVGYELVSNEEYFLNTINPDDDVPYFDENLKINPKDNTITIKKVKDSWNREEILNDIEQAIIQGLDIGQYRDKWIKENL